MPSGYNTLIVQATGSETITGNGTSNFLAVFGNSSRVNFNTGGGNGSIYAGGSGDYTVLEGSAWTYDGSLDGGDTVAAFADNSMISVTGADTGPLRNVVSSDARNVSIFGAGDDDLILVNGGTSFISMQGGGKILVNDGAVTISAAAGSSNVTAISEANGGEMDFINNSTVAASVLAVVGVLSGGSVTAFGGIGGGYYQGGAGGNNSLVGGSGSVILIGEGSDNYLKAAGGNNALFAGSGATTMIGAAGSGNNLFSAGTGSLNVLTSGSGEQVFVVNSAGQENLTGSTVSGAVNAYIFNQDSRGGGLDTIDNFRIGFDLLEINPNKMTSSVTISRIDAINQVGSNPSGSVISLSDNTKITLLGVSSTLIQNAVGGTML